MRRISYTDLDFEDALKELCDRTAFDFDMDRQVADILRNVRERGDAALVDYAKAFDSVDLAPDQFAVSQAERNAAADALDDRCKSAIELACENIASFSRERLPEEWRFEPREGVTLGERFEPLQSVGAYIPGGSAPLVSTVLHTISMATVAGVENRVVTTPAGPGGRVNDAILFASEVAGVDAVYRLGGVYGIGALAYGTETVGRVEKIIGPGNAWVTAAKRQVYGDVSLDLVAGPSEVLVIADEGANPAFIAADILAQAEHGSGREKAVLLTTSANLVAAVEQSIAEQAGKLSRRELIEPVLENGVYLIEVSSLEDACRIASDYGPEHLEIICEDSESLLPKIKAAGAVFLGPWTPEPVGDFVAGPSHVLPTGGAARFLNGLSIEQFFRRMSVVNYSRDALSFERDAIAAFAEMEGLDAHGRSVSIRFDDDA